MGYCHCESCRHWSAGPVNAFTLWRPEAVQVTRGADNIGTYNKTPQSFRKWCKTCGAHPGFRVLARRSHPLSGERAAHQGWIAQAEGCPQGVGRIGHQHGRIALARYVC
ncbi:GFA family protein [Pseudomonas donghuensis]|nr:GFA family protein [Pseudomonas donghuensis]MCP6695535.1 GFA family protein [Pseudomonas donghuensis]